jgi:hypothetical protein
VSFREENEHQLVEEAANEFPGARETHAEARASNQWFGRRSPGGDVPPGGWKQLTVFLDLAARGNGNVRDRAGLWRKTHETEKVRRNRSTLNLR